MFLPGKEQRKSTGNFRPFFGRQQSELLDYKMYPKSPGSPGNNFEEWQKYVNRGVMWWQNTNLPTDLKAVLMPEMEIDSRRIRTGLREGGVNLGRGYGTGTLELRREILKIPESQKSGERIVNGTKGSRVSLVWPILESCPDYENQLMKIRNPLMMLNIRDLSWPTEIYPVSGRREKGNYLSVSDLVRGLIERQNYTLVGDGRISVRLMDLVYTPEFRKKSGNAHINGVKLVGLADINPRMTAVGLLTKTVPRWLKEKSEKMLQEVVKVSNDAYRSFESKTGIKGDEQKFWKIVFGLMPLQTVRYLIHMNRGYAALFNKLIDEKDWQNYRRAIELAESEREGFPGMDLFRD